MSERRPPPGLPPERDWRESALLGAFAAVAMGFAMVLTGGSEVSVLVSFGLAAVVVLAVLLHSLISPVV